MALSHLTGHAEARRDTSAQPATAVLSSDGAVLAQIIVVLDARVVSDPAPGPLVPSVAQPQLVVKSAQIGLVAVAMAISAQQELAVRSMGIVELANHIAESHANLHSVSATRCVIAYDEYGIPRLGHELGHVNVKYTFSSTSIFQVLLRQLG